MSISGIGSYNPLFPIASGTRNGQNVPASSGNLGGSSDTSSSNSLDSAAQKFINYANENPVQRWLQQHGITQQQFDAMTPNEKQKLLAEIKQDIEEKMKERLGASAAPLANINIIT